MAKTGKTGIFGMLAFCAIILNAVAWILKSVASKIEIALFTQVANACVGVASLFLLVVVIYVSYDFAQRQNKILRIIWWVLVIVSLVSIIFGIGTSFI